MLETSFFFSPRTGDHFVPPYKKVSQSESIFFLFHFQSTLYLQINMIPVKWSSPFLKIFEPRPCPCPGVTIESTYTGIQVRSRACALDIHWELQWWTATNYARFCQQKVKLLWKPCVLPSLLPAWMLCLGRSFLNLKKEFGTFFLDKKSGETEEFLVMKYLVERLTEEEGVMLKGLHEHRPGNQ